MKPLLPKKPAKNQREKLILFALVELYLKTGKPIGSNTLKDNWFEHLSSATIRNYFAKLEEEGYLKQQHSSGGRIPTELAYRIYAEAHLDQPILGDEEKKWIREHLVKETREIASYLQRAAESLSEATRCAVFFSAPRFDRDFLLDIKLVSIDHSRILCVLITEFGIIHTETLYVNKKLSTFALKRLESYFNWKLTALDKPPLDIEEEAFAEKLYKEVMLRHIVSYTHFSAEDLFQAGFSKLLAYPDFNDASALASGLSLFENKSQLRALLNASIKQGNINCWIGDKLEPFSPEASACSVIVVPYRIHNTLCGAFGILGPNRIPYRELFGLLEAASEAISTSLTRSMYKFKITFRQPADVEFKKSLGTHQLLLEDKTHGEN
ncbi:MAG TPA: heat-inducible transcriptional repressor HrcA [Rhabdochlamydiaceae bacterium]|jgi:heat-inducible transcriptional repressor